MFGRRSRMGRAVALVILILLSTGVFFLTYNFVTSIVYYQKVGQPSGHFLNDPVIIMPENAKNSKRGKSLFHVAVTATDGPYSKWQSRIMYYWYKRMKDLPGSEMGKYTRILHSGKPDNLMDEIPSFVVDPLPSGVDRGYIVLHRPWAFVQWLEKATIEEEYILMSEPDHIFLRPLPNLSFKEYPVAYPFFYIKPVKYGKILRKFFPEEMGPVSNIDPIGNAPVIIKKELLEKIAPTWMNISLKMKYDEEADKKFQWVLEMYAYAVASALHGVQHILRKDFMLQPPWDYDTRNIYILHYTYGIVYDKKGVLILGNQEKGDWKFDKRTYLSGPPPQNLTLPPPSVPESVATLIKLINEATSNIPNWYVPDEPTDYILNT